MTIAWSCHVLSNYACFKFFVMDALQYINAMFNKPVLLLLLFEVLMFVAAICFSVWLWLYFGAWPFLWVCHVLRIFQRLCCRFSFVFALFSVQIIFDQYCFLKKFSSLSFFVTLAWPVLNYLFSSVRFICIFLFIHFPWLYVWSASGYTCIALTIL